MGPCCSQAAARQNAAAMNPLGHGLGQQYAQQQGAQHQAGMAGLLPPLGGQGAFAQNPGASANVRFHAGSIALAAGAQSVRPSLNPAGQLGNPQMLGSAQVGGQMLPPHLLQQQREQHQR